MSAIVAGKKCSSTLASKMDPALLAKFDLRAEWSSVLIPPNQFCPIVPNDSVPSTHRPRHHSDVTDVNRFDAYLAWFERYGKPAATQADVNARSDDGGDHELRQQETTKRFPNFDTLQFVITGVC